MTRKSNEEIIQMIERNNLAELNSQDELGFTVLHDVIERQRIDLIQQLLDKGVDISLKTNKGHNALEMAQAFERFFINNFPEQKSIINKYKEIEQMIERKISIANTNTNNG
jgi:ankyrin repeat protein